MCRITVAESTYVLVQWLLLLFAHSSCILSSILYFSSWKSKLTLFLNAWKCLISVYISLCLSHIVQEVWLLLQQVSAVSISTPHYFWPWKWFWFLPRCCVENNSSNFFFSVCVCVWQLVRLPGQIRRVCVQTGRQYSGRHDEWRAFKNPERDWAGKHPLWHANSSKLTFFNWVKKHRVEI